MRSVGRGRVGWVVCNLERNLAAARDALDSPSIPTSSTSYVPLTCSWNSRQSGPAEQTNRQTQTDACRSGGERNGRCRRKNGRKEVRKEDIDWELCGKISAPILVGRTLVGTLRTILRQGTPFSLELSARERASRKSVTSARVATPSRTSRFLFLSLDKLRLKR